MGFGFYFEGVGVEIWEIWIAAMEQCLYAHSGWGSIGGDGGWVGSSTGQNSIGQTEYLKGVTDNRVVG